MVIDSARNTQHVEAVLQEFRHIQQQMLSKIEKGHRLTAEELAEAMLDFRSISERVRARREEAIRAAKALLDDIDLEP